MSPGRRLVVAMAMLGAGPQASGAEAYLAAPDAIATAVQARLHERYPGHDRLAVLDRVFAIEKRIGAYRAARSRAELVERLNADLWVALQDRRVCVAESSAAPGAGAVMVELDGGLDLRLPGRSPSP